MNYTRAIFLISDEIRAINVNYDGTRDGNQEYVSQTMYKSLDQSIKVGDYVIVPTDTRHKMTVVRVTEVDVEPDLEASSDIQWIIGIVDRADYQAIKAQEDSAINQIKSAEKAKKRRELKEALLADLPEGKTLRITAIKQAESQ